MSTTRLPHDDLFATLDSALIAIEFAHITGETDIAAAAQREAAQSIAEALSRGYILDTFNCQVGDEVQNLHGDTGTITGMLVSAIAPRIEVRWDAPSPHPTVFTAAALTAGSLRHRR